MGVVLRWIVLVLALCAGGSALAQARALTQAEASVPGSGAWKPVTLPDDWERSFPGASGEVDYRLTFDLQGDPALQAVYIPRACTNLAVYLNGELLGTGGLMEPPVTRNCYYPFLFAMPRALLREHGNELRIRLVGFAAQHVSARQRAAGLSEVSVGPMSDLQPLHDSRRFWNITAAQIIATIIGSLGAAMLVLAMARRQDTYLLYFGLLSTGWALLGTRLFIREVPFDPVATEILICSAFPPVLGCAYQFLLRLVERRHAWVDALLVAQACIVPAVLVAAAPDHLLTAATTTYNILALEFVLSVAYFMRVAWQSHRQDFWLMGAVLVVAVVLSAVEIALQNNLLPLPKVHVIHFTMPFIFVVIGLRLIQQFVRALNRAETMNQELEQRVAEKSRELEGNWRQIAALRTAEAAQHERRRIASDLHDDLGAQLLTIAQGSTTWRDPERVSAMARDALNEMRLSVRGMVGEPLPLADVFADWRAETVSRLTTAGFEAEWSAEAAPQAVMPARTLVQLTRVLREAVSNAIRHSGGKRLQVSIGTDGAELWLAVQDDGRGLPAAVRSGGQGMANIERRVRVLGGRHTWESVEGGGTRLVVSVPLAEAATIAP